QGSTVVYVPILLLTLCSLVLFNVMPQTAHLFQQWLTSLMTPKETVAIQAPPTPNRHENSWPPKPAQPTSTPPSTKKEEPVTVTKPEQKPQPKPAPEKNATEQKSRTTTGGTAAKKPDPAAIKPGQSAKPGSQNGGGTSPGGKNGSGSDFGEFPGAI